MTTFGAGSYAKAGEADEVLLGFVFGTSFGLLLGGTTLIFYTNPESDVNIETVLITSGLIGATGGIILGSCLPDDAAERDPVVSMVHPLIPVVNLYAPSFAIAPFKDKNRIVPGIRANLIHFDF